MKSRLVNSIANRKTSRTIRGVGLLVFLLAANICLAGHTQNIMITGYWPPTNEMLREFSTDPNQNPGSWQGQNWEGRGYNIYAFFPEFPGGTGSNPKGTDDFAIDYQGVGSWTPPSAPTGDFWRLTSQVHPVALISYGQGAGPWEIECNARNLISSTWTDDYTSPFKPTPAPPDTIQASGYVRHSSLPVEAIAAAVNSAGQGINAWVDWDGDPGHFLCEYMAYHDGWYQSLHGDPNDQYYCVAAGFTHIAAGVSVSNATAGVEAALRATIAYLDSQLIKYTISGTITSGGSPLSGVTMCGLPGNPVTNASGFYTAQVGAGWSGAVTPLKAGYAFNSSQRTYSDVRATQSAQDYTASTATADTIEYDAASSNYSASAGTTLSWSHIVSSGNNRLLVVGIVSEDATPADQIISSVKFNSVNMTPVQDSTKSRGNSSSALRTDLYYMLNPPVGTFTVLITYNGSVSYRVGGAISLRNIKQQVPETVITNSASSATAISTNITVPNTGAWIVDVVGHSNNGSFSTSTTTERWDKNSGYHTAAAGTKAVTTSGSNTITWILSGTSGTVLHSLAAFAPSETVGSPPGQATSPNPANAATNVSLTNDLSWTAGSGATSHDVYFGTNSSSLPLVSSAQTATTYDTGTMSNNTTYYWRIDERNGAGVTTGTVWNFTTIVAAPGQAGSPSPTSGATGVSITNDLSWTAGSGATSHDVYFGTNSSSLPLVSSAQTATTYDTGTMSNNTTYYWRINERNAGGTTTGQLWNFITIVAAPGQASSPVPSTGAINVSRTQDLSWAAGTGSPTSHDVYFGTAASPPLVSSSQTATTYDTGTMATSTTYYWRIDEKNAGGTTTGTVWSFTTVPPPPNQATSPNPANAATNVSLTNDLSWTAGSGATSHDVYFGTSSPGAFQGNQTATTFDTGTMNPSTTYYWRIDEKNAGGTTTGIVWSFTTVPPPPNQATSPNPANAATNVSLTNDLSWTAGSGATSHDVYFGTTASPPLVSSSQTATTYDTSTMSNNTTYYWRIDEKNAGGTTTGVVWSFTTVPPPPNQATSPNPANAATNVSLTNDLIWTAGSGATSHDVYFGTNSSSLPLVSSAQTATTYDTGTMSNNTTYYWRIDEKNAGGTTTGTVWSFTTVPLPPAQAANPNPANLATNISTLADLIWTAGSGATSHDVYFGTSSPGTFRCNQTSTIYDPGTLNRNTTYYWRIDEKNAGGTTTGTVWSFTTIPPPPNQATSPNPANAATNVSLTNDLSWTAGSGATSHDVYFGTSSPGAFQGNQTATTFDTGTMSNNTTYYWRIDEKNAGGTTTGTVWSFTTVPPPPNQATSPNPANAATNVSLTNDLIWTAGSGATSHDVYFGTSSPGTFRCNQTGTIYDPGTLNKNTTYYWHIDEKNAGGTTTGVVWSFTTVPPPPAQATNPSPANLATNVSLTNDLSWTTGSGATSHDVYFGTSSPGTFRGNRAATTFDTGTMSNNTTYYWRIDEKNAGGTTTGTVWSFTTVPPPPAQASNPSPANLATNVSLTNDLSWTTGSGATSHDVYFGTSSPGAFQGNQTATTFDTGAMNPNTTYYWRIDEKNAGGTTTGTVWSFTTGVLVPNVVGMTQANANSTITGAGLTLGNITQAYSNTVPAGSVISQNPSAGTQVPPGSSVDMAVSLGKPRVPCFIIGMTQADASAAIMAIDNLVVGTVTQEYSDTVPAGNVIRTNPPCDTEVNIGSGIDITISLGRPVVPDVVGMTQAAAIAAITAVDNLKVGTITQQYSNNVPAGNIISQNPAGGTEVNIGSSVDLVVSLGCATVPNVVGMTRTDAEAAFIGSCFIIGTVTYQYSDTVPAGHVISQTPVGGVCAPCGSAVDLVISLGKPVVPDVVGMTQANASAAITAVDNLVVGTVTQSYSNTVAAGLVISQSPAGSTEVNIGSAVDITVSLGKPVVPDVTGMTQAAASAAITAVDNLQVGTVIITYSNTVPAGSVISQNPAGGTEVNIGSAVDITVSLGKPVVPDVTGMTQAAASAAITAVDNLQVGTVIITYSNTVPAGSVISQNPAGGTEVDTGSSVDIVVSLCCPVVPNVVGMTQTDAEAAIIAVDSLIVGIVSQSYSDTVAAGLVISQSPAGGTDVNIGSSVDITVSLGKPVVPDVVGMTQAAASTAITAVDNLKVGTVTQQYSNNVPSGNVMSQNPAGGTEVNIGSNVDIIVSLGKPKVPCFIIGMTQAAASASIIPIDNLVVGTVAQEYSDTVPAGNVIRINPPCDTEVNIGSSIDITISLGRPVVPDVVGMIQANASAAITAVDNLVVGMVSQSYSDSVTAGLVISQSPAGGTAVNTGSAVDLVISLGLQPPQAKDDFNDNRRGAMWRLSVENNAGIIEDANRLNITAVNQIDLTPFCIGHWNMDDNDISTTVIDISGNNHNGTAQQNTNVLHTTGKIDGALIFNGSTDYVAIGDIIGTGAYTKAAWVRLETSTSTYGHNILSGKPSQAFWAPNGYGNKLSAGHNSVWNQVQDSNSLAFGTWYFVALTYNATTQTLTLYKNGTAVSTGATTTPQPLAELNIGRYDSTATHFKGSIDNVTLFNRALTSDEIAALYNAGAGTETVPQYTTCNSEYSANTWSVDPNENFQTKVDYHYSAAGSPAGRIGITIEADYNNYVSILAGADGNSPHFQYEQVVNGTVTSSGETSRTSNDGTMYISYNAASDELYLSYTGYGSADAWQTISGLLDGQWLSKPLGIAVGGGSDGGAIDDDQAYLDNFEVTSARMLRWPVASDLNKDGYIDLLDIKVMSEHWLEVGSGITGDLNGDDTVNFIDFAYITVE